MIRMSTTPATPLTRPRSSKNTRKDNSCLPCIPTSLVLPADMSTSSISSPITTTTRTLTSSSKPSSLQGKRNLRTKRNLWVDCWVMTRSMASQLSLLWHLTRLILLLLLGLAHAGQATQACAFLNDLLLGPWYAWSESSSSRRVISASYSWLTPLSSSSPLHNDVSQTQRMSRTALSAAVPKKKNSGGFMPFFLFNNDNEDTEDKQSTATMDRSNSHHQHSNDTKDTPFPPFSAFTSTLASAVVTPLTEMVIHLNHEIPKNGNKKKNDKEDCEDSHLRGVQQCHEPAGNYPSTKSMQRRSTRSPRKVTFDQSRPTTIRQDLNNFSA